MKAILIAWSLQGTDKTRTSALSKKLYGQETSSHEGRYIYWRKGLLDDIPYVKLIRGVIIVKEEDSKTVIQFLRGHSAIINIREVVLTPQDERVLGTKQPLD